MRQTIYYGGPILTMEAGPVPEALLVSGDTITALGSLASLQAQAPGAELRDLGGHTLLPAFLDSHSHLTALASTLELCPLGAADSFAALGAALEEFAQAHPQGWIMGFGYDPCVLAERAHPTRQVLDQLFPDRPVLLTHASGHMGVLNSTALTLCGVTPDSPDPSGGKIGREADGRTPSGYLEENAFRAACARAPASASDPVELLRRAQEVYLSQGITFLQDGLTGGREYQMLSTAAAAGALTVPVVGYVDLTHPGNLTDSPHWLQERDHLKLGGYKIFLDGSPQGRTAWMLEPYLGGDVQDCGYPIHDDETVIGFVLQALEEGVQLLAHCNGDAAAAQFIRCCRATQERAGRPVRTIRPVMIHAQLVRREQLLEMSELGILPSFFAAHVWYWGDVHVENLGQSRANRISPLAWAAELGLPFTLHQDSPVIPPNMIESLWCATERITRSGTLLGPEQRISACAALKSVTVHAAYQYGQEACRGSLAYGKAADLVLLDRDPTAVPSRELRGLRVLETIRAGETVFRA